MTAITVRCCVAILILYTSIHIFIAIYYAHSMNNIYNSIIGSNHILNVNVEWTDDEKCEWQFEQQQNEIFSPNATKLFFEQMNEQNWSVTLLGDSVTRRIGKTFKYHLDNQLVKAFNYSDGNAHYGFKHAYDLTTQWTPNTQNVIAYLAKNQTIKEDHIFVIGVGSHEIAHAHKNKTREEWKVVLDELFSLLADIKQRTKRAKFIIRTITIFQKHRQAMIWNELLMQYAKQHDIFWPNAHDHFINDTFWHAIHHQTLCRYILLQQIFNAARQTMLI